MGKVHPFIPSEMFFKKETGGLLKNLRAIPFAAILVCTVTTASAASISC